MVLNIFNAWQGWTEQGGKYIRTSSLLILILFTAYWHLYWWTTLGRKWWSKTGQNTHTQTGQRWMGASRHVFRFTNCAFIIYIRVDGVVQTADTLLACWQCAASIFIRSNINASPCYTGTWSPLQGMVLSCRTCKVWTILSCPQSCMCKNRWVLWENDRLTCVHHGNEYVLTCLIDNAANVIASPQPKGEDGLFQKALVNWSPGRSHEVHWKSGTRDVFLRFLHVLTYVT
jgi:hypothetical protein